MARYDKYDPKVGGFRAPLAADYSSSDVNKIFGVGLNSSGQVVKGAGQTGVIGVLVLTMARKAGEIVDVMTSGEVVEFGPSDTSDVPGEDFGVAGTVYYSATNGKVTSSGATGSLRVGHTVEGKRLIVRCEQTTVGDIPNGSITAAKLADGAVETAKIANGAVTVAKIVGGTGATAGDSLHGNGTWSS